MFISSKSKQQFPKGLFRKRLTEFSLLLLKIMETNDLFGKVTKNVTLHYLERLYFPKVTFIFDKDKRIEHETCQNGLCASSKDAKKMRKRCEKDAKKMRKRCDF